jgi:hypothetical protein
MDDTASTPPEEKVKLPTYAELMQMQMRQQVRKIINRTVSRPDYNDAVVDEAADEVIATIIKFKRQIMNS